MKIKKAWRDRLDYIVECLQNSLSHENIIESKTTFIAGILAIQEVSKALPESIRVYLMVVFIAYMFFHGVTKL